MEDLEQPAELPDSDPAEPADSELNHDEPQPELFADDHDLDDDLEPEEDDEEIEVNGKKIALPKSIAATLKSERMMNGDYTRKTQEVAAERKAVAAEREQVQAQAREHQQLIGEVAKIVAMDERLAEYDALDWDALSESDPAQCQKYDLQRRALQEKRFAAANTVTQKQQQLALNEQQTFAKQLQDASAFIQREIPSWTPQRDVEVTQFVEANGIPQQQLSRLVAQHPVLAKLLHKAELYDRLEKKQTTAKPKVPTPPPAPVTRISSARATASKDPDKMSTEAWAKQFYADRAKRR